MVSYIAQRNGSVIEEQVPETESTSIRVTDFKYGNKTGYVMNRWLYNNLKKYPKHLKDYSSIGLVAGQGGAGGTQVGKSTLTFQMAYFIAWMLAGGLMADDGRILKYPTKEPEVKYFFDTDELCSHLYADPRPNQVIILDESDKAAGSRTAQGEKSRRFHDTIDRTASMHYVLFLVLPDFFRLGESWAKDKSDFLMVAYTVQFAKGYFKFYNRQRKEWLYKYGKMKGTKYYATKENFFGRFPPVFVGDYDAYKERKHMAVTELTSISKSKQTYQRDLILKKALELTGLTYNELSKEMNIPVSIINAAVHRINVKEKHDKENSDEKTSPDENINLKNIDPLYEQEEPEALIKNKRNNSNLQ
jgi:hypothetical protein